MICIDNTINKENGINNNMPREIVEHNDEIKNDMTPMINEPRPVKSHFLIHA